jgi:hypothetical protein
MNWRTSPPTVDEIDDCWRWWWREGPDDTDPVIMHAQLIDGVAVWWDHEGFPLQAPPVGEYAPCLPPDSAPPPFPPEVMEAAREALRLDSGTIDAIGPLADLAIVLARAILARARRVR